ncbi:MAG TPA: 30S ribosomal protein S6 [Ktedonobacterales bacterium]|nr:30S ribosomal protein S6 [Ktedonobacterales bacterium]
MARDRDYELGLIINPDVGEEQARAIVERVSQSIINNGGQVVRVNAWGRRRMMYPIQHHRDGLYYFFDLIMPTVAVVEIERGLRVNEDVIRHLMKVRDPKAVAQQRQRALEEDRAAEEARARAAAAAAAAAEAQPAAEIPVEAPAAEEPVAVEAEADTDTNVPTEAEVTAEASEPEATADASESDAS